MFSEFKIFLSENIFLKGKSFQMFCCIPKNAGGKYFKVFGYVPKNPSNKIFSTSLTYFLNFQTNIMTKYPNT